MSKRKPKGGICFRIATLIVSILSLIMLNAVILNRLSSTLNDNKSIKSVLREDAQSVVSSSKDRLRGQREVRRTIARPAQTKRWTVEDSKTSKTLNTVVDIYETFKLDSESLSFRVKGGAHCIDDLGHRKGKAPIGAYPCHGTPIPGGSQSFVRNYIIGTSTGRGMLRASSTRCVRPSENGKELVLGACPTGEDDGREVYTFEFGERTDHKIVHTKSSLCVAVQRGSKLTLSDCRDAQQWETIDHGEEPKDPEKLDFVEFGFSKRRTIQIGTSRNTPDNRPPSCAKREYYDDIERLPDTSVIICFVNEEFFALMRTVTSVLNNSPRSLIREIILVDDGSDVPWLRDPLDAFIAESFDPGLVRVVRSGERNGLIKARMLGASHAKGRVLTFLDSHVEASPGWLEPLLHSIYLNRKTAAVPVIPTIKTTDLAFGRPMFNSVGSFDWTMTFVWQKYNGPHASDSDPLTCPVMAGGLFSIERDYFYELGTYDENMQIWGGENLEISFRLWTCGGNIVIHPCSIVSHIFRKTPGTVAKRSGKGDLIVHNNLRVIEVWFDEFKDIFYDVSPDSRSVDFGDISERLDLRRRLQCKPFSWYLANIVPNMVVPVASRVVVRGSLRSETGGGKKCLDTLGEKHGGAVGLWPCHNSGGNQAFFLSRETQELRTYAHTLCVGNIPKNSVGDVMVVTKSCSGRDKWAFEGGMMRHLPTGMCMAAKRTKVTLEQCRKGTSEQIWTWPGAGKTNE